MQVCFITHIVDFFYFALFYQICHFVHNGFNCGCRRNLCDFNQIVTFDIFPFALHFDAATACVVHRVDVTGVIQYHAAACKVGCQQSIFYIVVFVFQQGYSGVAHFFQVEGTDGRCHTYGDTKSIVYQNIRESGWQQSRFFSCGVVVVHKVYCIAVNITEQFFTDTVQLCLCVTGGSVCHISAVCLTKVTFTVYVRHQQAFVTAGKAHHCFVDSRVAMWIKAHCLANDVGRFCFCTFQQAHIVHSVQQFAVRRLEAVYFRQSTGNNNAHGIRHIVLLQRFGDRGFLHHAGRQYFHAVIKSLSFDSRFFCLFLCHFLLLPYDKSS